MNMFCRNVNLRNTASGGTAFVCGAAYDNAVNDGDAAKQKAI
jgi:hypothetical protein